MIEKLRTVDRGNVGLRVLVVGSGPCLPGTIVGLGRGYSMLRPRHVDRDWPCYRVRLDRGDGWARCDPDQLVKLGPLPGRDAFPAGEDGDRMHTEATLRHVEDRGYDGSLITIGQRVEIHPGTDPWAQGARYGTIVGRSFTREDRFRVRLDALDGIFSGPPERFRAI